MNQSVGKSARLEQEKTSYMNALVVYFADSNIPLNCVERSTFYQTQKLMFQMGQIAGPNASFENLFENMKIQTRKKLATDSARIAEEFQSLLRLVNSIIV